MKNGIILQTARKGSLSVKNKNITNIYGKPCFLHNILYAKKSKYKLPIYVSTDIEKIIKLSKKYSYDVIRRPKYLCGKNSSHHMVIKHAVNKIEKQTNKDIDYVVILLGNNITAFTEIIDKSISFLKKNNKLDSVISCSQFNMFNPIRALEIKNGRLNHLITNEMNKKFKHKLKNDKKILGDIFFLNGSVQTVRKKTLFKVSKKFHFPWLGNEVKPIIQNPYCSEIDDNWQLNLILQNESMIRNDR